MKSLKGMLQSLHKSQYLSAYCLDGNNKKQQIVNMTVLTNGQKLKQQLRHQWGKTTTDWAQIESIEETKLNFINNKTRLSFLNSEEFKNKYNQLRSQSHPIHFSSTLWKTIGNSSVSITNDQDLFKLKTHCDDGCVLLVSDYFIPASNGLEKFYNIQRERKIWWMRYSANPSRYSVEPFDLHSEPNNENEWSNKCHSITIRSHFVYGANDMESITLVPLNNLLNYNNESCKKDSIQISLVRSVINLDLATCGMILDGCEHNRGDAFMIHRKLAPYQILLSCQHVGAKMSDIMHDLSLHIEHVLCRVGLRVYDKHSSSNTQIQLHTELMTADSLGIPYVILIDENSVKTGLMKLHSRDTTLSEIIHISDIPNYLLNIFSL